MKELIPFIEHNSKKAISARDLYEYLEVKERFSRWFNRQLQFGFIDGTDYTLYQIVHPLNEQETVDYALTLNCAKEISMLQRSTQGQTARRYFIACEKKLKELATPQFQLPQNFSEALRCLADATDENEALKIENKAILPKAVYCDEVLQSKSLTPITRIAKELGMTGADLNRILNEKKVIYKVGGAWVLRAKYQDKGYTGTKTISFTDQTTGDITTRIHTYWTEVGRKFIHELLGKEPKKPKKRGRKKKVKTA